MATLKNNYASGEAFTPGSTGGTSGINATNDRLNTHTHDGTDTAALSAYQLIVASGTGATSIVGDGTAQTVFTDSFSSTDGDIFEIMIRLRINNTAGADTPDLVMKLGSYTLHTKTATSGSGDANSLIRAVYSTHATAGRGYGYVEVIGDSTATGTAATNITKNDIDTYTTAIASVSATCDSAVGTTTNVAYSYIVKRHTPGI